MARTLGIDLGSRTLRAVIARTSLRKTELERVFEIPLSQELSPAEARTSALRELHAAVGRTPDSVIVAIDGEDVSIRPIELPEAAAKRIAEVLPFELESLLPFDSDEAILTHHLVGKQNGKLELLVAAALRERVRALIAELRDGAILPTEIAVGAAALDGLSVLMPMLAGPGPYLLVDLGARHIDMCIVRNGRADFARTITIPKDSDVAHPETVRSLVQSLAAYRSAGRPEPLQIFAVGGLASEPGMVDWLSSTLHLPAQPFVFPVPGVELEHSSAFARAAALAARVSMRGGRLNLRQGEFAPQRTMGAIRQNAPLLAFAATFILGSMAYATWAGYRVSTARNEELREQLAGATRSLFGSEVRDVEAAKRLLNGEGRPADPLPRFDAFDVLNALSEKIDPSIQHDSRKLEIEIGTGNREGHVDIQGQVRDLADRDRISEALASHPCLHELKNVRASAAIGRPDRMDYQLEAIVRCGARPTKAKKAGANSDE